jgi:RNA polymerase sigma factor (sigma-70 family)
LPETCIKLLMHELKYTQTSLLKGVLQHDSGILNYIYRIYYPTIRQHVFANSGNEEDARDVFQETMIVFYRKVKDPDFKLTSSLKTYLFSIAKLIWISHLKKKQLTITLNDTLLDNFRTEHEIISEIERNERLRVFRQQFDELSSDCKRVLKMFLLKVPVREITRTMGYKSDQHTKNRRYRCKMSLIKRIRSCETFLELGYGNHEENTEIPRW